MRGFFNDVYNGDRDFALEDIRDMTEPGAVGRWLPSAPPEARELLAKVNERARRGLGEFGPPVDGEEKD